MSNRNVPDKCRACQARIGWVYSVKTPKPHPSVPVNWDKLHAVVQNAIRNGERVEFGPGMESHFSTCPEASQFSRKGRKHGALS